MPRSLPAPFSPAAPVLLDMVHHNPGETPFATQFADAGKLAGHGFTGQVAKSLNFALGFDDILPGAFPADVAERAWLDDLAAAKDAEIAACVRAGIETYYHTDFFVLPRRVVESLKDSICDEAGRIDVTRPATLELYRRVIAALFARFPDVTGLMVRVGETYLFDAPYHAGNTAVPLHDPKVPRAAQIQRYITLINFLREEICVRHGRRFIHRTWDYFTDRFHADPTFYLAVTDAIEPHPLLAFSIKHTGSDFFRNSHANRCIGIGRHPYMIEVQCQREYEGKGAIPCYIARGVIDGFSDQPVRAGLRDWRKDPRYIGVFTWTRGGGWFGPYLRDEFWPELNARVLSAWQASPDSSEEEIFARVALEAYGLSASSAAALRELALASEDVILHGRYCQAAAELEGYRYESTNLWMRDDCLGGIKELADTFAALEKAGRLDEALAEKRRAAELAARLPAIAARITFGDPGRTAFVRWSADYAKKLFAWVAEGWTLLVLRWRDGHAGRGDTRPDLSRYEAARSAALALSTTPSSWATGFYGHYWNWPGQPPTPGMDDSVRSPWTPPRGPIQREAWQPQTDTTD
ncbi:MAG: hypothetical protein RLZZ50_905 [Verrucomicrobiota bacterium]